MLADDRGLGVGEFDVFRLISSTGFNVISSDEGSRFASSTDRYLVKKPV